MMTKEERERKAEEYVQRITAPTKENALNSMRIAQGLFLTKNGKFYSMTSDEYIKRLQGYKKYCKEEEQENWCNRSQALVDAIPTMSDNEWLYEAWMFEAAIELMEKIATDFTWDEIREIVSKQGHTGMTMSCVAQKLLEFSPQGVSFVDNIIKPRSAYSGMTHLQKAYEREKSKEEEKKQELGKRLIKTLNKRIDDLNS